MAFKFKPDKIKYLSDISTLDSMHHEIMTNISKNKEDLPKKEKRLDKLKAKLNNLDPKDPEYLNIRTIIIDEIQTLHNEIKEISNYENEIDYFGKTHDLLFDYYDSIHTKSSDNCNNYINNDANTSENDKQNNDNTSDDHLKNKNDDNIFNSDTLCMLNELSRAKRKHKRVARKRVKDVESLSQQVNDIFNYIGNEIQHNEKLNDIDNSNLSKAPINKAELYETYKLILDGKLFEKEITKMCSVCNIEKIFFQNEGYFACKQCGEVENCVIETEVANYKEPMVEKPIFPYKRKNHFRELIILGIINCSQKYMLKALY